jgi:hypothetical protein
MRFKPSVLIFYTQNSFATNALMTTTAACLFLMGKISSTDENKTHHFD